MRIFLIPLSRTTKAMHCHSTIAPSSTSYLNRTTTWAGKKWEGLGQAKPDSLKQKLYGAGTRMLEKIEHQETFLKEIPAKEDVNITTTVPFLYPSAVKQAQVNADLKMLIEQRIPYHRKYMIYSALWVPVTSLFTIVPLIPNIPFFYNAFRLWSHWKAYNGAKHLGLMVQNGTLEFQPSDVLNLGLQHDPDFAVFFTSSGQLSKKRQAQRKSTEQGGPKGPAIAESSGEITPTLDTNRDAAVKASSAAETDAKASHRSTTDKKDDPLSMTDHVVREGFVTDAEIEKICQIFEQAPQMSREIRRARRQEAEKFVKEKLMDNNNNKHRQSKQD
ncbi:hypothetical protein BGZ54_008814 [Gamsiella multidivaricata]|nr:hypothetical protein BGZ54_008814 [Gamsiella multidivaricata]